MTRVDTHPKIPTKDAHGRPNGYVVPIFNIHDGFIAEEHRPQQVYLTVVAPHTVKGPHLHKKRWGLLTCIKGNVRIVLQTPTGFEHHFSGDDHDYASVQVPAGVATALVNESPIDAYVLNMPSPAWRAEDPDQFEVTFPEGALRDPS